MPALDGATGWLNSEPLGPADLRGHVVLVDFGTYTCINWLRTLGYVRAWAEKYGDPGLVLVGVHTPEFPFEHDAENVRVAIRDMNLEHPIALDNDYAIWRAFSNHYWPAVYLADVQGRIRHHQFGEGGYEECERIIQRLLRDAEGDSIPDDLVAVEAEGVEAEADWANLKSPETYLGYERGERSTSSYLPGSLSLDLSLGLNQWARTHDWTVERAASVLNRAGGQIAFRFHARDLHLVLGLREPESSVPFRVLIDGEPPGDGHGLDIDERGHGSVDQQRLFQLVRQRQPIVDRTFEITFLAAGIEAYAFTFG